ncbi:MAG: hypothetical protein KDE08_12910 [Rhodobacteraceae bacterium]|nr:hypothetical protein [Paracoccaceae bacterium]
MLNRMTVGETSKVTPTPNGNQIFRIVERGSTLDGLDQVLSTRAEPQIRALKVREMLARLDGADAP